MQQCCVQEITVCNTCTVSCPLILKMLSKRNSCWAPKPPSRTHRQLPMSPVCNAGLQALHLRTCCSRPPHLPQSLGSPPWAPPCSSPQRQRLQPCCYLGPTCLSADVPAVHPGPAAALLLHPMSVLLLERLAQGQARAATPSVSRRLIGHTAAAERQQRA